MWASASCGRLGECACAGGSMSPAGTLEVMSCVPPPHRGCSCAGRGCDGVELLISLMRQGLHPPCSHPGALSTLSASWGSVHTAHIQGHRPPLSHPGVPSTLCASGGTVHPAHIQGSVHAVCVLRLHPLHAHPGLLSTPPASWGSVHSVHIQGFCLHCLPPGAPSTLCIQGCCLHCLHPGAPSTLCTSRGGV